MFHGSMVALVTPMKADLSLDEDAFRRLIDWHITSGTQAIVVMGTTGESATATEKEKMQAIRWAVDEAKSKIAIIAGTAAISVPETIAHTEAAMGAGVDACLLLSPPYVKPTQEGLYQYFREIARAVAIPQLLYNVPSRTQSDILPDTVARLAELPNIVAVKEATGELERISAILEKCGDKIDIYSGDDHTATESMLMGGRGVISVTANVAPKAMSDMAKAALAGDADTARDINQKLSPLHHAMFLESNPIPVKWALADIGRISSAIRLPLTPLSAQYHDEVRKAINID